MPYMSQEKEKPVFRHALIQGSIALALLIFLASSYSWDMTGWIASQILEATGIRVNYFRPSLLMYVRLLDGTLAGFQVLIECSGLVTVSVFALISTFTIGLLRGSIWTKLGWFLLSTGVGILWNINRLALVIAVAYNFGLVAFSFMHYLVGPAIDFLWVVSMWALGMSLLDRQEESRSDS